MDHVVDYILSDEFAEYSSQIVKIHAEKKAKTEELKVIYTKIKEEIATLDAKAVELNTAFEDWKSQKVKKHETK